MTVHQIREDCQALKRDWDKIADRLTRVADRDRSGGTVPDGYPRRTLQTDIPANDPESLTSVEQAADDRAFGRLERDPVHEAVAHARSALSQAALAVGSLMDNLKRAEELGVWVKPAGHTSTECCEPGCDDAAEKAGRCGADYMRKYRYEKDNPGKTCPPLTADELAKRNPPKRMKAS